MAADHVVCHSIAQNYSVSTVVGGFQWSCIRLNALRHPSGIPLTIVEELSHMQATIRLRDRKRRLSGRGGSVEVIAGTIRDATPRRSVCDVVWCGEVWCTRMWDVLKRLVLSEMLLLLSRARVSTGCRLR